MLLEMVIRLEKMAISPEKTAMGQEKMRLNPDLDAMGIRTVISRNPLG
jgi:hypothetical protein